MRAFLPFVVLLSAVLPCRAAAGDYRIDIDGGYAIVRSGDQGSFVSSAAGVRVVAPKPTSRIAGYAVSGRTLFVKTEDNRSLLHPAVFARLIAGRPDVSYFIIDRESGHVTGPLTAGEFGRCRHTDGPLQWKRPSPPGLMRLLADQAFYTAVIAFLVTLPLLVPVGIILFLVSLAKGRKAPRP